MADTFPVPIRQTNKECTYLEKNYLHCLLQKGLKDRIPTTICNMELVLFYHLECPDYVKKFDDPKNKNYLKRQMFNFLVTPYVQLRLLEKRLKDRPSPNLNTLKKDRYIPYPEEFSSSNRNYETNILNDEYLKSYVDGVAFTADKKADE